MQLLENLFFYVVICGYLIPSCFMALLVFLIKVLSPKKYNDVIQKKMNEKKLSKKEVELGVLKLCFTPVINLFFASGVLIILTIAFSPIIVSFLIYHYFFN